LKSEEPGRPLQLVGGFCLLPLDLLQLRPQRPGLAAAGDRVEDVSAAADPGSSRPAECGSTGGSRLPRARHARCRARGPGRSATRSAPSASGAACPSRRVSSKAAASGPSTPGRVGGVRSFWRRVVGLHPLAISSAGSPSYLGSARRTESWLQRRKAPR